MNEFVEQFLIEARELVDQATDDFLALEQAPGDPERLDSVFRAFHTLKGAAGIVDFAAMARALHAAEDRLSGVRAGEEALTPALIGDGLTALDQVVRWLDAMGEDGELPAGAEAEADALVARFGIAPPTASTDDRGWVEALLAAHPDVAGEAASALRWRPAPDAFFQGEDPLAWAAALPGLLALDAQPAEPWPPLDQLDPFASALIITALSGAPPEALGNLPAGAVVQALVHDSGELSGESRALLQAQIDLLASPAPAEGAAGRLASASRVASHVLTQEGLTPPAAGLDAEALTTALRAVLSGTQLPAHEPVQARIPVEPALRGLRVDVERIDALVGLAGELNVAKNALAHAAALARQESDPRALADMLKDQHAHLERLVGELQHAVLGIRVLPMRHVFQRFPRLVREMAEGLGKPARLAIDGDDTEADKAVVEALFEPLLHILRNAVDHGVESPAARRAAGKPDQAVLVLRALRQGDRVIVEVEDDGAGVDTERVRQVAAARGVASLADLAAMDEAQVADLIFAPGFSTAAQVSDLSGRGVGMDAVRSAVERMGGRAMVESHRGQGTIVRLLLPFSVMMSRVMTVEAGGQVFGLPLEAVAETVRVPRERILAIGAAKAFVLRGRTLPVIDLADTLGTPAEGAAPAEAVLVIAGLGGQYAAFEVDRACERLDVMLKPLDGLLAGMRGIGGTTLLGDGRVLLVLDLEELLG